MFFLSNRAAWKCCSLHLLDNDTQKWLADALQYARWPIVPVAALLASSGAALLLAIAAIALWAVPFCWRRVEQGLASRHVL